MWIQVVLLILGLALIIKGGDLFVTASVRLAELLEVSRVIIGSTLVSLATTSPELVVSVVSGLKGESGLSVGNAVGSCICNLGLVLGLLAVLRPIQVHPRILKTPLAVLIVFGLLLFAMTSNLILTRPQGLFLVACGFGYYAYDLISRKRHPEASVAKEAEVIEQEMLAGRKHLQTIRGTLLQFVAGAVVVIVGSKLLVNSAVNVAVALQVPSIIIGLTALALGTSLPELATMLAAIKRRVSDLAVGNILGANVANLTFVVGTAASLHPVEMSRWTQAVNFPAMLLQPVFLCFIIFSEKNISRREGIILLIFYFVYLALVVGVTIVQRTG